MAISVNKVTLVGRVGSEPVTRETSKGDPVCNLSIATNNGYGDNQTTDWHRVTFFGKLATVVSEYVKQGQELFVDGRITYRKYTDSNGLNYSGPAWKLGGRSLRTKNIRSATPRGFAKAVFAANS